MSVNKPTPRPPLGSNPGGPKLDLAVDLRDRADNVIDLLLSKRADYGTQNINMTGQHGVAVRLLDKISRLLNLTEGEQQPNHESIEDTWRDIVGYGLIGLTMEEEGEW